MVGFISGETGIDNPQPGRKEVKISEPAWMALIIISAATALLISFYCLSRNITTVFMHVYYFPIILLAYHYRYRGALLASALAAIYLGLVYFSVPGRADEITGAWIRFFVFIGIAAIIAFLSERLVVREAELSESLGKYHELFDTMMEGFAYCRVLYDENGRPADWIYLNVNPAFEQLTGLKSVIGKRALEVMPDIRNTAPEFFDAWGRVASTGQPEIFEAEFRPSNKWRKFSIISPEKDYIVTVFEDITARKNAESNLRGSEKRYRDLFEINNAVMFIIDPETGRIVDANDAASRFYGYSREELRESSITRINISDPAQIRNDLGQAAGSKGVMFQFRHRKKSGEIRDVQVFSAPITFDDRILLHSVIMDVTEQKNAEYALVQANKKLNLLSGITRHDIRNQLTALNAYLELARETTGKEDELLAYLNKGQQVSDTIARQIQFTKDYEELGVKSASWSDVNGIVREMGSALPLGRVQLIADCPGLEIFADPLVAKVFYNLIDNSLRYGGETMTHIRITARSRDADLQLIYEDDGNGIFGEDKKSLFTKGFGKNTGLGLFLFRDILAITGITITENGEPGKGARFEMVVPKGAWRQTGENDS